MNLAIYENYEKDKKIPELQDLVKIDALNFKESLERP